MNKKVTFALDMLITWLLVAGGMILAGWPSTSRTVYPVSIAADIVPAGLFMKFRLPVSWHRFGAGAAIAISLGIILAILRKVELGNDMTPMIGVGLVALAGPFLNKGKE